MCPWTPYAAIKPQDASNGDDNKPAIRVPAFLLFPGVVYQRKKEGEGPDPAVVAEFSMSEPKKKKNTHTHTQMFWPLCGRGVKRKSCPLGTNVQQEGENQMFASDRGTLYITVYIYTAQSALSQRVISGFCTNYHNNKKRPLSPWRPRPLCVENKLKMKKILSHPPAEKKKKAVGRNKSSSARLMHRNSTPNVSYQP